MIPVSQVGVLIVAIALFRLVIAPAIEIPPFSEFTVTSSLVALAPAVPVAKTGLA